MAPVTREKTILALGEHGGALARLADRAREFRFKIIRAKSPLAAVELARERGYRFRAAMVDAIAPNVELLGAIEVVRMRYSDGELPVLAVGPTPEERVREALRGLGAERILAEHLGDNELRFELNRTLYEVQEIALRAHPRAPTDWNARVFQAGRAKPATVYSVSGGGAFLTTPRPSQRGAELAVELPLPDGLAASVVGRVIYTNVPGNIGRHTIPHGMAVQFIDTDADMLEAIDQRVLDWIRETSL